MDLAFPTDITNISGGSHAPGGHNQCFNELSFVPQIAVLIGGIALYVAHRGGAAAVPSVLLNLSRWLIITSTFTFVYALYKVLMENRYPWRQFGGRVVEIKLPMDHPYQCRNPQRAQIFSEFGSD